MAAGKILIVDDERNLVEAVKYSLEREGYRTLVAYEGTGVLELVRREAPDLILLDWMLPGMDGIEICRYLKQDEQTRSIPIILLTVRSEETDKVLGLEMGADDYVTKPFSVRELIARVRAALRRSRPVSQEERVFQLGALRIDWDSYLVTLNGEEVELTPKEFELLKALIKSKGRVLSRQALLDTVWGYDRSTAIQTRTVDLHVSQLRKKLEPLRERILTVKGVGYRFDMNG